MASKTVNRGSIRTSGAYEMIRLVVTYLSIPLVLWLCAWDLGWWQGWAFSLLIILAGIGGHLLVERRHPGLLAERVMLEKARGVMPWDKALAPLMGISTSYLLVVVAGLDHRFGWSLMFPVWLNLLGLLLIALGYAFTGWAMAENRFFSTMVRIQVDRGHAVCDSGPYRIVRHPGYAGVSLSALGIVLALGSAWTLIPSTVALIIVVIRTALEDRTLQAELPGYREYAQRVRYRLVPWIY